ncbi:DUF397 domain-containing protein [Allosalinactinospora lopnorensis]|uniref:DUF397 domain-containing protein n=1 Tax=Allosalinactinospora lopnorensis TaxID=1352348 RepID=UPI000623EFB7|nr:DUF397 domain-containing protein [Allosalinactinospora lopnorensis]
MRAWRKSSYSQNSGGNCVEVAVPWRKSSYSTGGSANCVECRTEHERVLVRDTRHRRVGHLDFSAAAWTRFLTAVRRDEV